MVIRWAVTDYGHEQVINGDFVLYSDYQSLQAALGEALQLSTLLDKTPKDWERIAELRKLLDIPR